MVNDFWIKAGNGGCDRSTYVPARRLLCFEFLWGTELCIELMEH